jgi:hypothetical protein
MLALLLAPGGEFVHGSPCVYLAVGFETRESADSLRSFSGSERVEIVHEESFPGNQKTNTTDYF